VRRKSSGPGLGTRTVPPGLGVRGSGPALDPALDPANNAQSQRFTYFRVQGSRGIKERFSYAKELLAYVGEGPKVGSSLPAREFSGIPLDPETRSQQLNQWR